jgi:hypothetical protein
MHAGEWRGLEVAIKTVLFQSGSAAGKFDPAITSNNNAAPGSRPQHAPNAAAIASEAAIATNMAHRNIVATYSYDIVRVSGGDVGYMGVELGVYKLYLIQVCSTPISNLSFEFEFKKLIF